jgi:hypothetical protein
VYHQSHYPWCTGLINVQSGQDQNRSTIIIVSIRILTSNTQYKLTYLYGILKKKQEGRDKQSRIRKVTENTKKRSCGNILLNRAGINIATTRHSHCYAQPLLRTATATHSHCYAQPPPTNMMTLPC